ncbi:DUF1672 family protein [Gracilibacillus kekensis]|uniref:DUF1672 family protein n=1 Tax=Gracilibacillus kekensis TaxID=1027249 RepID=A0A1M7Q292_9BACI|nr:DUF1672 family protein [Gracilibacillus kekensis]SHN24355.1 Protein of unknown function [Gracilibacillus kekensis]
MLHKNNIIAIVILSTLLLGGCNWMSEVSPGNLNDNEEINTEDYYVPVQEYTGKEYTLPNGKETDRIANENREEIEEAIKSFFKKEYKTEVKVHNIVGNVDGATVMVESIGEPHFYTYAVIPINKKTEQIYSEKVFSQEGQVENAIMAGVYGMIMEEEFQNLNDLIEKTKNDYNLTGINKEAIPIGADRYSNEHLKVTIFDDNEFEAIAEEYLENPNRTADEWKKAFNIDNVAPKDIVIAINLFMTDQNVEPNQQAFEHLIKALEQANNIPKGAYAIRLHDNYISKNGSGSKDNSIERAHPDELLKD